VGQKHGSVHEGGAQAGEQRANHRRAFLKGAFGALLAAVAGAMAWPLAASLVSPVYRKSKLHFSKANGFRSMPLGQPVKLDFSDASEDAFLRERVTQYVWAVKHSDADVTVFSPVCTHLGCRFGWHPDLEQFICPCHGSVFSITGKVLGGPAPRALDTLPSKIEDGELWVQWERFEPGTSQKVPV
jgi:menaquinol-cytochrome c reductase iron-sulfur subunit